MSTLFDEQICYLSALMRVSCCAAVPQREPYDPMSFPPGLIPSLVQEKHRTELPYSPLSPLEIEQAGLPPAQEPDAYLTSRIEKFNAELRVSPCCICTILPS